MRKLCLALFLLPLLAFGEGSEALKLGTQTHNVQSPLTINWTGTTLNFTGSTISGLPPSGATVFTDLTDVPSSYTGAASKVVSVKSDESGLEFTTGGGGGTVTSVAVSGANGISVSGSPITTSGTISLSLPITIAGTSGKTLTVSNNLTLAGTDGSTLNIGGGGTLGSAAFTASSAYEVPLTFSDSLSRATNTVTLTNDSAAPGNSKYYGTDSGGVLGYFDLPTTISGAALTKTDDTNVTLSLGGSPSTALVNAASITVGWTGTLAVARGGTGAATSAAHKFFGNNTGSTAAPDFESIGSGDLPDLSGTYVPTSRSLTIGPTTSDLSADRTFLGNVTNDAQTKAAIVPNTAPSAGQILVGNAGGTAYAPVSMSGNATLASTGAITVGTLNQNTTGSAASLSISGQTGLLTVTGLASTNRIKTVRDAADTILELGGSYTPTGTWNWTSATVTWPTFNQNTTGSAATLTTSRNLWGEAFNGSANVGGAIELGTAGTTDTTLDRSSAGHASLEGSVIGLASDNLGFFTASTSAAIGVGTIELGHATDTTIARSSAGHISVEGSVVGLASNDLSFFTASTSNAIGVGTIELGHATDTTLARNAAGVLQVEGVVVPTISSTSTETNKKITKRIQTMSDATSITPNSDTSDIAEQANTQAAGTLTVNAPTAVNVTDGQSLLIVIKSTNIQTFAWNAAYNGGTNGLPTSSTGSSKVDMYAFVYCTLNGTAAWNFTGAVTGF